MIANNMFWGRHYHHVDEKGRIALPAKFRPEFAQGAVVFPGGDDCLLVYPFPEWKKMSDKLTAHPLVRSKIRRLGRFIFGESSVSDLDAQGRVPLPQDWRMRFNIKGEIVIVGNNRYLEVWDKETFEKERSEVMQGAWQIIESLEEQNQSKGDEKEG